jgi:hypothetical protein
VLQIEHRGSPWLSNATHLRALLWLSTRGRGGSLGARVTQPEHRHIRCQTPHVASPKTCDVILTAIHFLILQKLGDSSPNDPVLLWTLSQGSVDKVNVQASAALSRAVFPQVRAV